MRPTTAHPKLTDLSDRLVQPLTRACELMRAEAADDYEATCAEPTSRSVQEMMYRTGLLDTPYLFVHGEIGVDEIVDVPTDH